MKIGTISININTINHNYGAILHSWAFQQVLLKYFDNIETELIDYIPRYMENANQKYPVLSYYKKGLRDTLLWTIYAYSNAKKYNKVKPFIEENFIKTAKTYDESSLEKANLDYDVLICESDVIWDPNHYDSGFEKAFFLALDSMKDKKRISYAASLGNAEFTEAEKNEYIELLKNVDYISVREKYAAEFTANLIPEQVEYVLDPTLLLDENDYCHITHDRIIKEKYLLIYFPLEYNEKLIKQAIEYAKMNGLKVVEISRYIWNKFRHKVYDTASVEEFLSLIKYAEVIFTNSFHGVCFSVVFEKEFYAFTRKTGKKIRDICDTFELMDRFSEDGIFRECSPIDYEIVNSILNKKRKQSMQYLRKALENNLQNSIG